VFDITDAIAVKNCTRALKLLNDMIILKEPVQKIFFMMTRQLRQLLQVKILKNKGCGQDEIAKQMGIAPFIAAKLLKQAASFSETRLKKLMELSLELDVAVKTGKIKDEAAAELLIISMSE
ncbi:MAG: DNA polymerase III subunit delta, partial [Clostridiales bacterium]|nr:DNA polymerase III subunit delta [Clostridiales bacterium]